MQYSFEPIGVIRTCFKEKFGIPRQSGLVRHATGILKLRDDPFFQAATRELETFSHLWLVFVFHQHDAKNWKPSIRPPRLGGAVKVGVLASRSPHRPNPIGMSVVRLDRVDRTSPGGIEIHLSGLDLLDGTPILDIKPYIPYADSVAEASSGWADDPIVRIPVKFTEKADEAVLEESQRQYPQLRELIEEMLGLDPRPAFQKRKMPPQSPDAEGTFYGFRLFEYDVKWKIEGGVFVVLDLVKCLLNNK